MGAAGRNQVCRRCVSLGWQGDGCHRTVAASLLLPVVLMIGLGGFPVLFTVFLPDPLIHQAARPRQQPTVTWQPRVTRLQGRSQQHWRPPRAWLCQRQTDAQVCRCVRVLHSHTPVCDSSRQAVQCLTEQQQHHPAGAFANYCTADGQLVRGSEAGGWLLQLCCKGASTLLHAELLPRVPVCHAAASKAAEYATLILGHPFTQDYTCPWPPTMALWH